MRHRGQTSSSTAVDAPEAEAQQADSQQAGTVQEDSAAGGPKYVSIRWVWPESALEAPTAQRVEPVRLEWVLSEGEGDKERKLKSKFMDCPDLKLDDLLARWFKVKINYPAWLDWAVIALDYANRPMFAAPHFTDLKMFGAESAQWRKEYAIPLQHLNSLMQNVSDDDKSTIEQVVFFPKSAPSFFEEENRSTTKAVWLNGNSSTLRVLKSDSTISEVKFCEGHGLYARVAALAAESAGKDFMRDFGMIASSWFWPILKLCLFLSIMWTVYTSQKGQEFVNQTESSLPNGLL